MFESDGDRDEVPGIALPEPVVAVLDRLRASIDELFGLDLVSLSQRALLDLLSAFEVQKRRLPTIDHALVAELGDRKIAFELSQPNDATMLRQLLMIGTREARAQVQAAADLGPRRTLLGEPLDPLFGSVASAQADGSIGAAHARIIIETVGQLPDAVAAEHESEVIARLLAAARVVDPDRLYRFAKRVSDIIDPDGTLADYTEVERRRELNLSRNRDGSYTISGRLTPLCGAIWAPILDVLSKPVPGPDGARDSRFPGQRRADGFESAGQLLMRADQLPHAGGAVVSLAISMTEDQVRTGEGLATTGTGDLIPVTHILELAGETQTMTVKLNSHGGVMDYGQTERIVPPDMRRAITARDKGCTFPGCDRPPAWTEAHHFVEFALGGPTSIDNCGLACGFHHRTFERQGWQGQMINGVPHWLPPAWLDPEQKPLRNTTHDTAPSRGPRPLLAGDLAASRG